MVPRDPIKLSCGHETRPDTVPKVAHPDGRKMYECPVCGVLAWGGKKK